MPKKYRNFSSSTIPFQIEKNSQDAFINYTTLLYYLCQNSISFKLSLLSHRHVKSNGIVTGIISPSLEEKKAATLGESSANYDESGARRRDGKKENERSVGEKKEKKNKVCGFRLLYLGVPRRLVQSFFPTLPEQILFEQD